VVDALFGDPRLAAVYDVVDGARDDLVHYLDIAHELGARRVIDLGCGTGTFACLLAQQGFDVVGVDPAAAMLDVARAKPGAERVRWVHGDAAALAGLVADLVTMTGNVAQVFIGDDTWLATLAAARGSLTAAGCVVFETRDPAREAWKEWNRADTLEARQLPDGTRLTTWVDVVSVALPLVTFRHTFHFEATGKTLTSESTLRFRTRDELAATLATAGFAIHEVRDAPDRPGREWIVLAVPC
jgi:SAM-dependent methyltransferase